MTKRMIVAVAIIVISGVVTATVFLSSDGELPFIHRGVTGRPTYNYLGGGSVIPNQYREPLYNDITGDWRPKYVGMKEEQYQTFFGNLPPFPEDFYSIVELVYDGKIVDYGRISEDYWKQPEFFAGWYGCVNESYIYNDPARWIPEGYGIFPIIKEIKAKRGDTYTITAYVRTGFGTESYQGIIFRPELPPTAKDILGNVLFEQPEDAKQYITPRIINPDNPIYEEFKDQILFDNVGEEDWFVILKPTYRLIKTKDNSSYETGFPEDWCRLMNVEIEIDAECPSGMYCVGINSDTPCFEINQEFYYSQEHEYYGGIYYPAGRFHKTDKPHFQIMIEVTP